MDEFARDLRAALAAQQSELGELGDAPRRLLRQGLETRRRPPMLQVAGALAALLVIAAVATVLMLARQHPRATSPATPAPAPSPTWHAQLSPLTKPLNVPDNVPVILYRDPANRNQVDGVTWDGKTAGRVATLPANVGMLPNPAGTRFLSGTSILDRSGSSVATLASSGKGLAPVWTDDGQRLCGMAGTELVLLDSGRSTSIAAMPALPSDQTGMSVAACSTRSDRAIVRLTGPVGNTLQYWVVQLSTGRVLNHKTLAPDPAVYLVASADANVIGEGRTVFDTAGNQLGMLSSPAVAFSANGSVAVLDGPQGAGAAIVATGRSPVVFPGTGQHVAGVYANPDDPGQVAIALSATGDAAGPDGYLGPAELFIASASGASAIGGIIIRF